MAIPSAVIDEKTRQKLGESGLAELAGSLYPVDCQTCGRPLGTGPPALCVDDMAVLAMASLHHQRCRMAGWNDKQASAYPLPTT